ncbi:type II toxin-antitoxin system Phd/YefM family antitoxin [Candidatus Parcubacteria bacterium]|nr:type II toxin-antitoxin system Phd/YefM family antitoxin [Candidatus Parcubacteria bacterium]
MDRISISQLKMHPSKVIAEALDYPLAVESRNKVKAYLIGKELYENIVCYVEDHLDRTAVQKTDFGEGRDFEQVAKELGL